MNSDTYELVVRWCDASRVHELKPRVAEFLESQGYTIVEGTFDGGVDTTDDSDKALNSAPLAVYAEEPLTLEALVAELTSAFGLKIQCEINAIPAQAWQEAWAAEETSEFATTRFRLVSVAEAEPETSSLTTIKLSRGLAFGSGAHATTLASLEALEALPPPAPGAHLLDVGTGNGVLAIAARHCGYEKVTATEIDEPSLAEALSNAKLNGIDGIAFLNSAVIPETVAPYAVIIANIPVAALSPLIPAFAENLAANGYLIVSGFIAKELISFAARAAAFGLHLITDHAVRGWVGACFIRRPPPVVAP